VVLLLGKDKEVGDAEQWEKYRLAKGKRSYYELINSWIVDISPYI
jgi:hypothetical protein